MIFMITLTMANYLPAEAGFDLNELPEEALDEDQASDFEFSQQETNKSPAASPQRSPSSSGQAARRGQRKTRKEPQAAKPRCKPQIYAKFLKLMDTVAICDKKDFDVAAMKLPEYFAAESRVLLLLMKIGNQYQIKPEDRERYHRILKNCGKIQKAMAKQNEDNPDNGKSEMAGHDFSLDRDTIYDSSPLDYLRAKAASVFNPIGSSRFSGAEIRSPVKPPAQVTPQGQPKTLAQLIAAEQDQENAENSSAGVSRFFTFL